MNLLRLATGIAIAATLLTAPASASLFPRDIDTVQVAPDCHVHVIGSRVKLMNTGTYTLQYVYLLTLSPGDSYLTPSVTIATDNGQTIDLQGGTILPGAHWTLVATRRLLDDPDNSDGDEHGHIPLLTLFCQ